MPPVSCKVGSVLIGFLSSRGGPTSTHRKATITGLSELETNYQPGFFDLFILRQCYIVLSFSSQTVTWTWKHPFFFFLSFRSLAYLFFQTSKTSSPGDHFRQYPNTVRLSLSPFPFLPLHPSLSYPLSLLEIPFPRLVDIYSHLLGCCTLNPGPCVC